MFNDQTEVSKQENEEKLIKRLTEMVSLIIKYIFPTVTFLISYYMVLSALNNC